MSGEDVVPPAQIQPCALRRARSSSSPLPPRYEAYEATGVELSSMRARNPSAPPPFCSCRGLMSRRSADVVRPPSQQERPTASTVSTESSQEPTQSELSTITPAAERRVRNPSLPPPGV